ncbi:hypothetical protein [Pseudoroseomonas cervicalis]|uniref:hypothetical protein n=1 Tax=Teichococcus cervicalis TaxID=204525 RepID=UPI0027853751|nr:hypothetical protein [Pseudoroseomonas cervicalis]MDQ1081452.1 hypothetical protein [Pseudoroseomonas cervicalis]
MCLAMAACGPTGGMSSGMELGSGRVRVMPDPSDPKLLIVNMFAGFDIGYDLNDRDQRHAFVRSILAEQCGQPAVIAERATITGLPQGLVQRKTTTYTLSVRCPNGASTPIPL